MITNNCTSNRTVNPKHFRNNEERYSLRFESLAFLQVCLQEKDKSFNFLRLGRNPLSFWKHRYKSPSLLTGQVWSNLRLQGYASKPLTNQLIK